MQIVISKDLGFDSDFIHTFLPRYIYKITNDTINAQKLTELDNAFKINSLEIIRFATSNLSVNETSNDFVIKINKNLKYKNISLELLINLITYGNLSVKGYPLIEKIFNFVAENIFSIYKEWEES